MGVRICGRMGSSKAKGRAEEASGSRLEFMSVFTRQDGTRRTANCPTKMIRIMPRGIIKMSNVQSRRSFFSVPIMIGSPSFEPEEK